MRSILAVVAAVVSLWGQERPVFRVLQDAVTVNVAVKERNRPVAGLSASDFRLLDNGVRQQIQSLSVEDVPVDITMFLDTSGSTATAHRAMANAVERVRQMLRPTDRFRVLTIGVTVDTTVDWRGAEGPLVLDMLEVHGISLVFDAVFTALAHTPAPGRRHLVIALTDGQDACSLVSEDTLTAAAARSESLLHWVVMSGAEGEGPEHVGAVCTERRGWVRRLEEAANVTGGETHSGWFGGADPVQAFQRVFSDFRQSYVLLYSPEGVTRTGWHKLQVDVPGRRVTVRARSGYYVD